MSTGISISSINRIKELAEEKKFKEALEILDTQNLDKSINPQFLKISGEIFRENKRYYDSRRILLKAHQMAPQGNRIIHELIQLYLELGYFSKARKYYEQYLFYTTPDDTQKDYVEYIMKKAEGADVKELATILIPILERMPEDKWNFEAILLYHKMDRKDMALEESRYILENFKESEFVQPVIDYIDDKLDVDKYFYVYPKEEQPEDTELFGDLIELEEKILDADYRSMYPPEARIMVEADDNDAPEVAPVKEKKEKKRFGKKSKKDAEAVTEDTVDVQDDDKEQSSASEDKTQASGETDTTKEKQESDKKEDNADSVDSEQVRDKQSETMDSDKKIEEPVSSEKSVEEGTNESESEAKGTEEDKVTDTGKSTDQADVETATNEKAPEQELSAEEQVQKERQEALDKILSKKIDADKIKESAKQVAKAVKEIDTDKAKKQVKSAAVTVKDNVKKATDVFGVAMGAKVATSAHDDAENTASDEDVILDGIIESVLEPPKRAVGQVVMNEELDALIPDSLEAMSEKEIADIEAKKEELERLELEALEATLKLEEEKKAKKLQKKKADDTQDDVTVDDENAATSEEVTDRSSDDTKSEDEVTKDESEKPTDDVTKTDGSGEETSDTESSVKSDSETNNYTAVSDGSMYTELKNRFMEAAEEEKPLDSLGFITVVHSDVDSTLEDDVPDAAGMLRQMIDNKEFYSGENSLGFESKASYENHGFEVEDCDFDTYRKQLEEKATQSDEPEDVVMDEQPSVQDIFTQESVVAFEEVASEEMMVEEEPEVTEEPIIVEEELVVEEPVVEEEPAIVEEELVEEEPVVAEEPVIYEDVVLEEPMVTEEPVIYEDVVLEEPVVTEEPIVYEELVVEEPMVAEEPMIYEDVVLDEPMVTEEPAIVEEEFVVEEPVIYEDVVIEEPEVTEEPTIVEEELVVEEPEVAEEPVIYEDMVLDERVSAERENLRADIILSYRMENLLANLKESR